MSSQEPSRAPAAAAAATPEEVVAPRPTCYNNPLCTAITILVWYVISNSIILKTKWLFSNHFPFPLTVTVYSNGVTFLWAVLLSRHPKWRAPWPSPQQIRSYVLPIGVTMGLEIGCSNLALKILTVSFGTILKGGAPVFTFFWGFLFGLETFSFPTIGCLVLIAVGIALASLGEGQEFQLAGFCLQLFATALGGLRWAMTHKMLQDETAARNSNSTSIATTGRDGMNDSDNSQPPSVQVHHQSMSPLTAILYTSPMTALCVLPFALGLEGSGVWDKEHSIIDDNSSNSTFIHNPGSSSASNPHEVALIVTTMTAIATLVFCLLMSEYWLVKATSSLALSVAGVVKELLTIGGGIFFFAEQIDWLNVVGFVTCQFGIVSYVCLRYERQPAYTPVTAVEDATSMLEASQEELFLDELLEDGTVELPMYTDRDIDTDNGDGEKSGHRHFS